MATTEIKRVSGTELYLKYPRQLQPQPVVVSFDLRTRVLTASVRHDNTHSGAERCGLIQLWAIPPMRADAANALLEQIAPLAERISDGSVCGLDRDGKTTVKLSDDAREAIEEIDALCDGVGAETKLCVWEAVDWFAPMGSREAQRRELGIDATTTDERLAEIVEGDLSPGEVDEISGGLEYLQRLRDEAREVAAAAE